MKAIIRILFFVLCGLLCSYLGLVYDHNSFDIWNGLSPKEIVSDVGHSFAVTIFVVAVLELLYFMFKIYKEDEY